MRSVQPVPAGPGVSMSLRPGFTPETTCVPKATAAESMIPPGAERPLPGLCVDHAVGFPAVEAVEVSSRVAVVRGRPEGEAAPEPCLWPRRS